ncbi:TPA: hypothetical protein HA244_04975 [Candidatus Micrarchaeota archaeon]|nr:hypothetical protein [Candidatus Micrarchaeota archaeon]
MHEHNLRQVIGAGPSAEPFARAIVKAYRRRHGTKIALFSLGRLGEEIKEKEKFAEVLKATRPKLDLNAPTLVFDELYASGETLANLSEALQKAGLRHKTAVLVASENAQNKANKPHYIGTFTDSSIYNPICAIGRGTEVVFSRNNRGQFRRNWVGFKRLLNRQLDGIVTRNT